MTGVDVIDEDFRTDFLKRLFSKENLDLGDIEASASEEYDDESCADCSEEDSNSQEPANHHEDL
eukprot:9101527-Karenia_brevis.AAC.1